MRFQCVITQALWGRFSLNQDSHLEAERNLHCWLIYLHSCYRHNKERASASSRALIQRSQSGFLLSQSSSSIGSSSSFSLSGTEEAWWDQPPKLRGGKQAPTAEAAAWPPWQGLKSKGQRKTSVDFLCTALHKHCTGEAEHAGKRLLEIVGRMCGRENQELQRAIMQTDTGRWQR